MKAWIVRETGEVRAPNEGELFMDELGDIVQARGRWITSMPILSVTPLPDDEQEESKCSDEWDSRHSDVSCNSLQCRYFREGWLACYDYLTGHKKETKPVGDIGRLRARVKELEEKQKWIDEVGRPDHPDDERPWASEYLNAKDRIKQLEDAIKKHQSLAVMDCENGGYYIDDQQLYAVLEGK